MRLLLVDDDTLFGAAAQRWLVRAGFVVDWIRSAADLHRSMRSFDYDCVLLDLNLGDAQGKNCLREIRQHDASLPLIVITARAGRFDRINLLELGADDYRVKPVDLDEVRARVRAVTRRKQLARAGDLVHGELRLQAARRTVTWKGQPVTLTDREFMVLDLHPPLAAQAGSSTDPHGARHGLPAESCAGRSLTVSSGAGPRRPHRRCPTGSPRRLGSSARSSALRRRRP